MAIYAIGDIQGCHDQLQRLLDRLRFDPTNDRLWFAGDLVNRGPKSLETLRFVRALGEHAVTVLGNHDLHLLAVWRNRQRHAKASDTLQPILDAPDRDELLDWLRRQPLLHREPGLDYLLVHAGLSPQWDLATAESCAREIEAVLAGPEFDNFLEHMYGNKPRRWDPDLTGWERLRYGVNCFTRLRFVAPDGALEFGQKGAPGTQEAPFKPWFKVRTPEPGLTVLFGHWSTLGLYSGEGVRALDTGCLWGGSLSALRLDDGSEAVASVECEAARRPSTVST